MESFEPDAARRVARMIPDEPRKPPAGSRLPALARAAIYTSLFYFLGQWLMLLCTVIYFGVFMLLAGGDSDAASRMAFGDRTEATMPPPLFVAGLSVLDLLLALVLSGLFVLLVDGRPFRSLGFLPLRNAALQIGVGVAIPGIILALYLLIALAFGWQNVAGTTAMARIPALILAGLAISFISAAGNELALRGYLLQAIERRYGTLTGILAAAAVYAALHLQNRGVHPLGVLGEFSLAILFGAAYAATRRLWLPIVLHAMWNVWEGPALGFRVSGMALPDSVVRLSGSGPQFWTGGLFGPEGSPIVIASALGFAALLWLVGRRLFLPAAGSAPRVDVPTVESAPA